MTTVLFRGYTCKAVKRYYGNGRPALVLLDAVDGQPIAVATINIPEVELGPNEVIVKDYSENEGLADVLIEAAILKATNHRVLPPYGPPSPICEILI